MTEATGKNTELEINVLALLKILWIQKRILLAGLVFGTVLGWVWYKLSPKIYSSSIVFIQSRSEVDLSAMQGLGALSMLGVGSSTSEPPLLKHLERYIKTREFIYPLKDSTYRDKTLLAHIVGKDSANPNVERIFYGKTISMLEIIREDGLITLKASYPDSQFAFGLATLVFEKFSDLFNQEQRRVLQENLVFMRNLVDKSRFEMQSRSNSLRVFMERNRESGTPFLEEERRQLLLNLKMAEEKYIQAEKEKALLEIKNEKKEEGLVVIERPFVPNSPDEPKMLVCLAVSVLSTLFFIFLVFAFAYRRRWIFVVQNPLER